MGTIYKFVTRTVLHNSFTAIRSSGSTFSKYRKSVTYTLIAFTIAVLFTGLFFSGVDDDALNNSNALVFLLIGTVVVNSALLINLIWILMETGLSMGCDDDFGTYEPKFARWIGRGIRDFYKEVARSNDEQEEVDKKRKVEIKEKRLEVKRKKSEAKRLILEMKNAEKNKFNRFEVMEID